MKKCIFKCLCGVLLVGISSMVIEKAFGRTIEFAGRGWFVKSGYGGPGENYWSDSEQSVWVDGSERLHLKIRHVGTTWYCAEVNTLAPTRYGMHRFYTISRLDNLDKNVVVGLFLYKNDWTEVDIEFSKWGWEGNDNGWYVIHPSANPGNVESFSIQLTGTYTTHYMDWHSSWIQFKSIHGHYEEPPNSNYLIYEWLYTGSDIPYKEENLKIHINLWLYDANGDEQGDPPSDGQEVEIIIADADLPSTVHDIALDDFWFVPHPLVPGQDDTLHLVVTNEGDYSEDVTEVNVAFEPTKSELTVPLGRSSKVVISPGETVELIAIISAGNIPSPGSYNCTVCLPAVSGEIDTEDNCRTESIEVLPPYYEVDISMISVCGWNMVSVPVVPEVKDIDSVFPGNCGVFTWAGMGYVAPYTVAPGVGYWVCYVNPCTITVIGEPVTTYTRYLVQGWNMIGSTSESGDLTDPNDNPDGSIIGGTLFGFDPATCRYVGPVTAFEPTKGYWVAAIQPCSLTVSNPTK